MGSNNYVYHHDNHHLASTPTGGPAFVAHASGYHNDHNHYGRPNLDFLNNDLYYDNHDNNDAPPHNDDDYARANNDDDNGFNDYDEYDDPADYEHLVADHDNCSHNNNFCADWNDYYDRWIAYFNDISTDYLFPPPDDYYRR